MSQAFHEIAEECTPEELQLLVDIHNKMSDRVERIIAELRESD